MFLKDIIIWQNDGLARANIIIKNGIIKEIVISPYNYREQDRDNFFITPGFVNAHLHPNKILSRGLLDDLDINDLLSKMHVSAKTTYEIRYLQALFTLMDAIMNGATTIYAVASNPLPVIDAFSFYKLRGAISCFFNDCWDGYGNKPTQTNIKDIDKEFNKLFRYQNDNIKIHIGSASTQSASNELLILFNKLSEQLNTKVNIHISEGSSNVQNCLNKRNSTPIRLLNKLRVLNSRCNLIHATCVDKEEAKMISENGSNVILCPVSNAKVGVGVAPIREFIEENVNLTLGTDSCSNNNTNNILNEAYVAQLLYNAADINSSLITHRTLCKWLTINARKLFDMHDMGEIKVGQRADLLLWSLNNMAFAPLGYTNFYSKIFYNAPDLKPHTVLIGGIKAVENYKFKLLDPNNLLDQINDYSLNHLTFD